MERKKIIVCNRKEKQKRWTMKRNEVYFADLGENIGNEENKVRPVVVIQSNSFSYNSPVVTVAIISSSEITIPDIQVQITGIYTYIDRNNMQKNLCGAIDLGQIRTIGKERIVSKKICQLKNEVKELDIKLLNTLGLNDFIKKKDNTIKSLHGKIEYLNSIINKNT